MLRTGVQLLLCYNNLVRPLVRPRGVEPRVIGYKPIPQNRRGQGAYITYLGDGMSASLFKDYTA